MASRGLANPGRLVCQVGHQAGLENVSMRSSRSNVAFICRHPPTLIDSLDRTVAETEALTARASE